MDNPFLFWNRFVEEVIKLKEILQRKTAILSNGGPVN